MLNTYNSIQAKIQLKNRKHACMFAWTVQTRLTDVREQVLRPLSRSNNSYTENRKQANLLIYHDYSATIIVLGGTADGNVIL